MNDHPLRGNPLLSDASSSEISSFWGDKSWDDCLSLAHPSELHNLSSNGNDFLAEDNVENSNDRNTGGRSMLVSTEENTQSTDANESVAAQNFGFLWARHVVNEINNQAPLYREPWVAQKEDQSAGFNTDEPAFFIFHQGKHLQYNGLTQQIEVLGCHKFLVTLRLPGINFQEGLLEIVLKHRDESFADKPIQFCGRGKHVNPNDGELLSYLAIKTTSFSMPSLMFELRVIVSKSY